MQRLVILGGGESGFGAAVLGKSLGMEVFLSDSGKLKDNYRRQLEEEGIEFETGHHTREKILNADMVVKSPGIPDTAPLVKALREKGVEVISEIEFAGRHTSARMVCITGSNGKTTTTSLVHHVLKQSGIDAGLAGNIGHSLALQVARSPKTLYVIELSSFQLDGMSQFKADVAILLNITPDHLDRYGHKMQNYVDSKFRIIRNQTPSDYFIYWSGDTVIRENLPLHDIKATPLPFSTAADGEAARIFTEGETAIEIRFPGEVSFGINRSEIPIKGLHNLYNTAAAALACTAVGLSPDDIRAGIASFQAVEHRLEFVAEIDGVRWINDSKATNVASTYYALESMDSPTVLILGGTDKGNDYTDILPFVKQKVKAIVCMGVDNAKIVDFFYGQGPAIADTHSLEEAVKACRRFASPGDTVLLSPCCASFDLFNNYEHRGHLFKQAVMKLSP